jgi:1-acyl-sn-glycerol-3-phosphate acyltransferase
MNLLSRPDRHHPGHGAQRRRWEEQSHAQHREHGEHRTFPAVSTVASRRPPGLRPALALLALFETIAVAVPLWIGETMPTSAFQDFLSILLRAFYRLEVRGLENLDKAGGNAIVALNHVSFLDGAVALAILSKEPVFAVDREFSQRWWVRPFIRLTRAMPLDPTRPLARARSFKRSGTATHWWSFPRGVSRSQAA